MCVYDAEAVGGSARVTPESLDVRWYSPSEIPWRELAFPSTRASFHDYFRAIGLGAHVPRDFDPGEEF